MSFISGLTDVDAITLSSLRLVKTGMLGSHEARHAITIAVMANLLFKLGLAGFIGGMQLMRKAAGGFLAMALVGVVFLFI